MTAINHALTGAIIGLTVHNPLAAVVLAFLSHFVLDAIPHYDQPEKDHAKRIASSRFLVEQLVLGAGLCLSLVIVLGIARPSHWLLAAVCAFVATSPDLLWIPRFLHIKRTGKDVSLRNWFWHFHSEIQWKTGPAFIVVELLWFAGSVGYLATRL